jgi:thioredoxin reductase (NADPH)
MYDLVIIGGGPAGLSAAIYAARYQLKTVLMTREMGGAMAEAYRIENYPGFKEVTGVQLTQQMSEQVKQLGVDIVEEDVQRIERNEHFKINNKFDTRFVLLALGTQRRKLDLPNEEKFVGKGVSYCASCDAPFFKDKRVGVVGGRDAACMAADLLTQYAEKVIIIYRGDHLRAQPAVCDKTESNPKIETVFKNNVTALTGDDFLKGVKLDSGREIALDGLFIEIGGTPSQVLTKGLGVKTDKEGYVEVDEHQETNVEGVYAAGDMTTRSARWRQIVTACAEGALAVHSMYSQMFTNEKTS